jgi:hypothetical protein
MLTYPEHAPSSTLPSQRTAVGPFLVTTDFHGANIRDSLQQSNGVIGCGYKQCEYNVGYKQGRGVHVTGVSAAYTFKLNKNILSE